MIKLFINSVDKTSDFEDGTLTILDQIQNKSNTCYFALNPGATIPSENQEVLFYDTVTLVSASGTAIVVNDILASGLSILDRNKFRVGETFWLDIDGTDEEKITIAAIEAGSAGQVNITAETAIVNSHAADEDCGKLIFGGTLTQVATTNPRLLTDVAINCQATDFTKIFDRKLINDSWEDHDARYVINDALNTTINYNTDIDQMDYANDGAVQAEWLETGDGDNPTNNTTDYVQGDGSVDLNWTNAGGSATFTASPTSQDISEFTGAASGAATSGNLTFWYESSITSGISSVAVRIGSDPSHYTQVSFTPSLAAGFHFISLPLVKGAVTGTPDWTACDYIAVIVTETVSGALTVDDIRVTADKSFTMYNFESTIDFDDIRASFKKPTVFLNSLADFVGNYWFIDYERDIHFFDRETSTAPFEITDTSDNFDNLSIDIDASQLKNRQVVRGGTKVSDTSYSQVVEGDSATREWIMKGQFENLTIELDDGSSTDLMEAGTTTTNVTAVGHGLVTGDYIVNRTRSNAVRSITKVDNDNFTVEAVTAQTNGDTFSKFDTAKTVGIEFIVDETTVDYVSNFNEKSIRATDSEVTLDAGDFLLFTYDEIIPIRVQVSDYASIVAMKALIGGDGIFDGAVITDTSLNSTQMARDRAQAEVDQYSNAIVNIDFVTDYEGLESGQILSVTDTNKGIDDDYVIQKVKIKYKNGFDFPVFSITAASSLFGIIEYFQQLSEQITERLIDEDEVIDQIVGENVTITISDVNTFVPGEAASESATVTVGESNTASDREMTTDPYLWQPDASDARWNLAQYK